MLSNDEWRQRLGRQDLSDAELDEFVQALRSFLSRFLDDYFRDEFTPDEV